MIKWVILLVVSVILWISEYRRELRDINSEFVQPKTELVPFWNMLKGREK